jgi:hypothetical protein
LTVVKLSRDGLTDTCRISDEYFIAGSAWHYSSLLEFQTELCNYAKGGSDFVDGNMDGDTCIITNKAPPPGKPPGEGGARRKRDAGTPTINVDTFEIDFIPYFSLQSKPVLGLFLQTSTYHIHSTGLQHHGGKLPLLRLERLSNVSKNRHWHRNLHNNHPRGPFPLLSLCLYESQFQVDFHPDVRENNMPGFAKHFNVKRGATSGKEQGLSLLVDTESYNHGYKGSPGALLLYGWIGLYKMSDVKIVTLEEEEEEENTFLI